ncbi:MAG: LysR family transcriptional regulator [Burkholderiales bacterium PBB5]|nr:MAG: LysR family transcriptional regulator [Burkholderiales bacterium PBB5]
MLTNMRRLPLNTLPAFLAVARLGSVRAAADELHLTHSAVSQQLRLLEDQLGFALFARQGRRLRINDAGTLMQRAAESALAQLDNAGQEAAALASGARQHLRLTLSPSFAQRWLLPRMGRWRARHPDISLELHSSMQLADLGREGLHAGLRQGSGPWRGLVAERLLSSPRIAIAAPDMARRLAGRPLARWADEPLLGSALFWTQWFALSGLALQVHPVAAFNDAGLMLQAVEQGLGLALVRTLLAADGLRDGSLVQLSPQALAGEDNDTYWLVYPPAQADWPPLVALRQWLADELARSAQDLAAVAALNPPAETVPAGR